MKKTMVFTMLLAVTLMSFINPKPPKRHLLKMGTYSTCACDNTSEDLVKFGLTLNDDFTFHYFDKTNASEKIDVKGTWVLLNKVILLRDYPSKSGIDNKWTIEENGNCLKSRKGLSFTRLCNIKECK